MVAPIEQRFNAAVNVIRGLPKHGSYQPSKDMLLRFYAYFKQATIGPCTLQRPAFWNVVDKVKWDAYNALGNMPREHAMELYVNELKKIIETMSYTDNVAEFMGSVGELGDVDIGDLEAVAPEAIKQVRSRPNSPFASRESSPVRSLVDQMAMATAAAFVNGGGNGGTAVHEAVDQMMLLGASNGYGGEYTNGVASDQSDDEYIDTVEDDTGLLHGDTIHPRYSRSNSRRMDNYRLDLDPHDPIVIVNGGTNAHSTNANALHIHSTNSAPGSVGVGGHLNAPTSPTAGTSATTTMHVVSANVEPALHQMLRCVEAMRVDLQQINNRINIVERSVADVRQQQRNGTATAVAGKQVSVSVLVNVLSYVAGTPPIACTNCLTWFRQLRHGVQPDEHDQQTAGTAAASAAGSVSRYAPAWWPLAGITPAWFVVMAVVWPLVARRLVRLMQSSRRR